MLYGQLALSRVIFRKIETLGHVTFCRTLMARKFVPQFFKLRLNAFYSNSNIVALPHRSCRKRWSQNPDANKHYFGCIVSEYKTAKSLSVVMVVFVLCWTPFFVFSFFYTYCQVSVIHTQRYTIPKRVKGGCIAFRVCNTISHSLTGVSSLVICQTRYSGDHKMATLPEFCLKSYPLHDV